jgi:hypothetical protein
MTPGRPLRSRSARLVLPLSKPLRDAYAKPGRAAISLQPSADGSTIFARSHQQAARCNSGQSAYGGKSIRARAAKRQIGGSARWFAGGRGHDSCELAVVAVLAGVWGAEAPLPA